MKPPLETAANLLGVAIADTQRLHGGDLSEVHRITTSDGRSFVAKSGSTAEAEAEMLRAIRAAGAPAPQVVAVSADLLILQDLARDDGVSGAWTSLGQGLRRLHSTTGEFYGWPRDHSFGPVAIPNCPTQSWPEFWAEHRLLPSCPVIPADLARQVEALANRLDDLLPAHPPASLLHGDLWTGNIMARAGRVTGLIDPAAYFGDAEVDLAMLTLFGSPDRAFWQEYGAPFAGYEARQPIYQLWPALVHHRLFGTGYRSLVQRCLTAVL